MKSPGEQKQEISTTTSVNNTSNLSIKRTSYLFNHISKLAAGHDVRVSGTMIKVTYKKALKEGFISSTCFNVNTSDEDSGLDDTSMSNSINALNVCFNQDRATKTVMNKKSVCDSESSAVPRIKTSTCVIKGSEQPIFHSTPKVDIDITERKKREYINGLNLLVKLENENSKSKVPTNNFHFKPSIAMNSHNTATSHSVLSSKSVQIKASTSDKFQSNSIKIPKGITIIKVKGNINSKNDKVQKSVEDIKLKPKIKKTSSENNLVIKDIKKHKIDLKRRIKIGEGVVANKIRKSETNNQCVKKKFKKTKEVSRKISSPSETLRKKKLIDENSEIIAGRSSKKELLKEDPDLPPGWKRVVLTRYEGTPFEKHVVYIYR